MTDRATDSPLMLSVSGLRGLVGRSLTPVVAARYGAAFGQWLKQRATDNAGPHIVVARDSRPSGQWVEYAVTAGLIATGCRVTSVGVLSTPGAAVMVDHLGADGGMVITASHNPIEWNGIKALRHDGIAPPPDEAADIIQRFKADDVSFAAVEALHAAQRDDAAAQVHVDRVLKHVDVDAIRKAQLKAVVDSVHGAGGEEARLLLDGLGVERVPLYAEPTGLFPHTPEPLRENLRDLCAAVREHGAHAGFAQDPDADRLAIVDERGEYIGEEYTLALATLHMFARRDDPAGDAVVANLSTSRMIDDIARQYGGQVVRTAVGEANVAAGMREHHAPIGGEGNGGVILPPVTFVRDSLVGMALVLEMLALRNQPLSHIVDTIPRYAIVKQKLPVDDTIAATLDTTLRKAFADARIDTQDGVRLDWPDRWVHVRLSNTEPIMRLIAEARTEHTATELITQTRRALHLPDA